LAIYNNERLQIYSKKLKLAPFLDTMGLNALGILLPRKQYNRTLQTSSLTCTYHLVRTATNTENMLPSILRSNLKATPHHRQHNILVYIHSVVSRIGSYWDGLLRRGCP